VDVKDSSGSHRIKETLYYLSPTVSHNILIGKLRKCRLDEWTVRWIENWLNGRTQRAVISSAEHSWRPVTSGVPQGSVRSAVLFSLIINDLDKATQ